MKCAKGLTCHDFVERVRAFIDNELPVNDRTVFLEHADACPDCRTELKEMRTVVRCLNGLTRVTVSPEFDFSLRNRLTRERDRMQQPLYRFRLHMDAHRAWYLSAPLMAASLVIAFLVGTTFTGRDQQGLSSEVAYQLQQGISVPLIPDDQEYTVGEVRYVLERVRSENGVIIGRPVSGEQPQTVSVPGDLMLVNY